MVGKIVVIRIKTQTTIDQHQKQVAKFMMSR